MAHNLYYVVFEYKKDTVLDGFRSWAGYDNREHFQRMYSDDMKDKERVIAEDVTPEKALEICSPISFNVKEALIKGIIEDMVDYKSKTRLKDSLCLVLNN